MTEVSLIGSQKEQRRKRRILQGYNLVATVLSEVTPDDNEGLEVLARVTAFALHTLKASPKEWFEYMSGCHDSLMAGETSKEAQ